MNIINLGTVPFIISELEMQIAYEAVLNEAEDVALVFESQNIAYCCGKSPNADSDFISNVEQYYLVNRGGKITIHSPGQLVVYIISDLKRSHTTIDNFVFKLEQCMIDFLLDTFRLTCHRNKINNGCYINNKKIGFVGIRVMHGITMYGFAINIYNNLELFKTIIPCGINNIEITNVCNIISKSVNMQDTYANITQSIANNFK